VTNTRCGGHQACGNLEPLDLNLDACELPMSSPRSGALHWGGCSVLVSLQFGVTKGPLSTEEAVVKCRGSATSHFQLGF
jgi:hypothetical protein